MSNRRALSNAVKESKQPKQVSKPKDIDYNSQMGYRDDSPFRNKSSIDINTPTGTIDMSNTGIPLMANGRYLPPYSGTHQFDTNVVRETPFAEGGTKKRKKQLTQPGQWAGVNPELVQPGNETFNLPTTPTVPAEFETVKCPMFHRYDPNVGDCVPFTEEEKAAYALDYMQGWVGSPMHEQMLRASIEKDAPAGNIDKYVKDITDLRLRATDPNISIVSPDDNGNYGVAEPLSLDYDVRYKSNKLPISLKDTEAIKRGQDHDFDTLANPNKNDLENYIKYGYPLYMESGVNNLEFFKFNNPDYEDISLIDERGNVTNRGFINKKTGEKVNMLPEIKSLKQPATFYTKDLAGEHGYVYPHEFSHLQDMGGDLIIPSDKNLMLKYFQPQLNAADEMYEKTGKVYDKYYRPKGVYDNPSEEDEKKYKEEIGNIFIDAYPSFTNRFNLDKNLYQNNFDKYVLDNQHRFKNVPTNNSLPYEEFIKKYFSSTNFGDPSERAGYLGNSSESRARLNAIRMYGKASGVYDPYTEKLTPEKYNQLKELFQKENPNAKDANQLRQLQEVYKDEDILNMLNTISKNDLQDRTNEIDQAKKGGGLKSKKYSRSLQATNKFFRENPLFEKPKKLSKKRIYDPNAKYYQDGGLTVGTSTSYPSGLGVGNLANYVPSQMADLKLANSFKFKDVKTPLEISIGTPLGGANSRLNTYQGFEHPDTNASSVGEPTQTPQDLINKNKANFNNWQETTKGAPIDFRVKQSFYGVPQDKNNPLRGFASVQGGYHPQTGFNAGAEGGLNLVLSRNGQANRYFSNRGLIPKQTVFIPQLTMGFGVKQKHKGWDQDTLNQYENLLNKDAQNNTTNSFDYLNEEGKKGHLTGSRANVAFRPQFTVESRPTRSPLTLHGTIGANINMAAGNRATDDSGGVRSQKSLYTEIGAKIPVDKLFDKKSKAKSKIQEIQDREQEYERERPIKPVEQKEPEEQTEWIGEHPRWLRDGGSTDNYVEIDIPKDQIQKYVDGGYVVEEVNDPSIPALTKAAKGGASKGCKDGEYWDGTKCTKLITLKNDKKYIDGVADWRMHVSDPNKITSAYNDSIKDRLYSGKWGLDPESGALVKLSAVQPKSVTTVDAKTKASREKEKLTEKNYRAEEENKKAYEQSIIDAGFDPATFGKAKGVNTITGEPIYTSSKEEAERINQEAINQAAIEGHAAVVNNPVFKTVANFTPAGMAIGAIEGLARFIPDAYTLAQDPTLANAGQLGMNALQALPVVGKPLASATGKAFNYVKNLEPSPPGPLMLLGRTNSGGNMVKKNISYYDQLLKTYDSKAMSATNKKFYKDLIATANKQDGMVTEAQLRELDRLKTGNFDFGKRGFNKESLVQVEPKAPGQTPKSEFKSEIDWGKWNKEIPENAPLMQEYNTIEETAKANGTWMKNPDGSPFQGTPEQFVQQQSQNFKNAFGNSKLVNPDGSPTIQYHGSAKKFDTFDESKFQLGDSGYSGKGIYTSPDKTTADSYAVSSAKFHKGDIEPTVYELYGQANNPISSSQLINENKGRDLFNFHRDRNWQGELSPYESLREYDAAISDQLTGVQNIRPWHNAREVVFPTNKQLKSAIGNNGMFDMSNPNIYKAIIPTVGVTGLTGLMLANPFQGSSSLPQQKKGGITDNYIEMDIPKSKVQWYIDNGYEVEVLE